MIDADVTFGFILGLFVLYVVLVLGCLAVVEVLDWAEKGVGRILGR
jgi:hypothetical protein